VRAARQADWPALTACYTRFAQRYRGMLARSQKQWEDEFADTEEYFTSTYYYARDGAVEGYLVYSEGKEEKTELQEFIALTPEAQAALLGLLRRQEMQTRKFAWAAPEEDPLFFTLCHTDVETKLAPVTQGRVVDVPGALAAWRPQTSARGAVTVAIQDECAPWNAGTWRIEAEDGQISCRRTDAEAQVSLDIQAFSQAFFGTPTVDTIRAANRLTVHDEAGFTALRALFDGPPMWMNDHF
jgi:predicted acetyltransferase